MQNSDPEETPPRKVQRINWSKYGELQDDLVKKLEINRYDLVIGIARGGLPIAVAISNKFDIPMQSVTIRAYSGTKRLGKPKVLPWISNLDINGKKVLLVDDLCDTGDTMIAALDWVKLFDPSEITVAALYVKPTSKYIPVISVETTDAWIVFPYEPNI
jgi:hypoxanthine phosphoribosyltransferase